MIKSIFYTRFLVGRGTCVLHQVPEGSIVPPASSNINFNSNSNANSHANLISASTSTFTSTAPTNTLFDFSYISDYVIPRQKFCDRLVTVCINRYRILGYPVCIKDRRYERNEFIFSIALVLEEEEDKSSYEGVVRKLGLLFRSLEEQGGFLSREEQSSDGTGDAGEWNAGLGLGRKHKREKVGMEGKGEKIYALCEMILEDLNNYCECMIPIDSFNTLNLKLFPARRSPPTIHPWHVPLSIVRLNDLARAEHSSSWDLTLLRIIPFIDGVTSVAHISQLADTDLSFTRKAIAHLVYYGCIILLDIFQFGAVYAPTADFGMFVESRRMREECLQYVTVPKGDILFGKKGEVGIGLPSMSIASTSEDLIGRMGISDQMETLASSYRSTATVTSLTCPVPTSEALPGGGRDDDPSPFSQSSAAAYDYSLYLLIRLYASLKQGLTLRNWCVENAANLNGIDVRRFITFGVIKGFLYRAQKYAIASTGTNLGAAVASSADKAAGRETEMIDAANGESTAITKSVEMNRRYMESVKPGDGQVTTSSQSDFPFDEDDYHEDGQVYKKEDGRNTHKQHSRNLSGDSGGGSTASNSLRNLSYRNRPSAQSQSQDYSTSSTAAIPIAKPKLSTQTSYRTQPMNTSSNINSSSNKPTATGDRFTTIPDTPPNYTHYAIFSQPTTSVTHPSKHHLSSSSSSATATAAAAGAAPLPNTDSGSKSHKHHIPLGRYLDGMRCFDQICTELEMPERDVMAHLRGFGDVHVFWR